MAKQITINFSNDYKYTRDLDAVCKLWGYQDPIINVITGENNPNPKTKQQFVEDKIKEQFQAASKTQRRNDAINNLTIEE